MEKIRFFSKKLSFFGVFAKTYNKNKTGLKLRTNFETLENRIGKVKIDIKSKRLKNRLKEIFYATYSLNIIPDNFKYDRVPTLEDLPATGITIKELCQFQPDRRLVI